MLSSFLTKLFLVGAASHGDLSEESRQADKIRYRTFFEESSEAIFMITREGKIIDVNPVMSDLFGYTREEMIMSGFQSIYARPEDYHKFQREIEQNGEIKDYEVTFRKKDGTEMVCLVTSRVHPRHGEDTLEYQGIIRNVTGQKQTEEELRRSRSQLLQTLAELKKAQNQVIQQERLSALGTMASGIAHDFNNALSPILSFSEVMMRYPEILDDKEKVARFIKMINTAAKDATSIVSRLREFYRQREAGEIFFPVDLNQLVEEIISLTQPKWETQQLANGITINIETDLGRIPAIAGNEAELREVLTNLVFNAVEAMPENGTLTFRTRTDGNQAVLEVCDTGVGMTEEVRERCLEPFFSTKGRYGTGLGLAVLFGIIQRHDGTVDIESKPGQGTTFSIHLPTMVDMPTESRIQESDTPVQPLRILLVDDEPLVRQAVAEYLIIDGHTVETATNGREGLEKFHAGWFDIVVSDWAMPEMTGDQLAAAIKQVAPNKPVILITGFGDWTHTDEDLPEGVDCIVTKPIIWSALQEALASVKRCERPQKVE